MTFDEWAEQYDLDSEYQTRDGRRYDCRAAWDAATKAEREACAKACENLHEKWHWGNDNPDSGPNDCAAEIRKRSNA